MLGSLPPSHSRRPSLTIFPQASAPSSQSRTPRSSAVQRTVRLTRALPPGGGSFAPNEDRTRCAVAARECLRIVRVIEPEVGTASEAREAERTQSASSKFAVGRYGHRIEASRNMWEGSGLKVESTLTDVAWASGTFNHKLLTGARNGELIMWDLQRAATSKYETRMRDHTRAVHDVTCSTHASNYCITGSADSDMRVWDMRNFASSVMRIHHPTAVRAVLFSPDPANPLQAISALDNGSIYRWDLKMGQRGLLDRLSVAHAGSILALDWCAAPSGRSSSEVGLGWLATGGMDRTVKVWEVPATGHIKAQPKYTMHTSSAVRAARWRPGSTYSRELVVASASEIAAPSSSAESFAPTGSIPDGSRQEGRDTIEVWDVRRGWLAKWAIQGSATEGGVTDIAWADPHALWVQHANGTFAQLDARDAVRPVDSIPRTSLAWGASGMLAFVADRPTASEAPYEQDARTLDDLSTLRRGPELGDESRTPRMQGVGVYVDEDALDDASTFTQLARSYVLDSSHQAEACLHNAKAASASGRDDLACTWTFAAAALRVASPEPSSGSTPAPAAMPALAHSHSAPAAIPRAGDLPITHFPSPLLARSMTHDSHGTSRAQISSGRPQGQHPLIASPGPMSPSPSPLGTTAVLHSPSISSASIHRRTPSFVRRPSFASNYPRGFDPASRRPSLTPTVGDGEKSVSPSLGGRLRHVGDGALDDDSSSSDGASESNGGFTEAQLRERLTSEDWTGDSSAPISPRIVPSMGAGAVHPSPLSRIAGGTVWTEDEVEQDGSEDSDSPSPASSTDPESDSELKADNSINPVISAVSRPKPKRPGKNRSRASTLISLRAPRPALIERPSGGSVRTVLGAAVDAKTEASATEGRRDSGEWDFGKGWLAEQDNGRKLGTTERRRAVVGQAEHRLKRLEWDALREILECYATQGNIQMCAALAMLVSEELGLSSTRALRFVDSYIDLLVRLRLFTSAAYVRKQAKSDKTRAETSIHTTVYATCGRCRRTMLQPAVSHEYPGATGSVSFCSNCRIAVTCAICHLPVRALMFQCATCSHGGHQACYARFYMHRPAMATCGQDGIFQYPCAAGCGHICWSVSGSTTAHAE